uniref:Uncharacterized protein n=1 Tax=Candidatus Kentrum sp. FW TaxID=2126338 RepID=A0A450T024_9GAMM|nr:MAG: hypothetical protein BECKFW1821A_GA0114235_109310 [Candidatus Kentron sp. FW]
MVLLPSSSSIGAHVIIGEDLRRVPRACRDTLRRGKKPIMTAWRSGYIHLAEDFDLKLPDLQLDVANKPTGHPTSSASPNRTSIHAGDTTAKPSTRLARAGCGSSSKKFGKRTLENGNGISALPSVTGYREALGG